jgi:hypothetical protein
MYKKQDQDKMKDLGEKAKENREKIKNCEKYLGYYLRRQDMDIETRQKILAHLDGIDALHKQLQQQRSSSSRWLQMIKCIKFVHDKERKVLYFTGKFDNVEEKAIDDDTGKVIIYKYKYSFYCYDTSEPYPFLSIWPCDITEASTVLDYLSKNETILEVICNGGPRSKSKTYQINPPLD